MTRRHEDGEREIDNSNNGSIYVSRDLTQQNNQLDVIEIAALIAFFKLLDKWDREAMRNAQIM